LNFSHLFLRILKQNQVTKLNYAW